MKTKLLVLASLLVAARPSFATKGVDTSQLPRPASNALDASAGERVKKVTIQNVDGRNAYDIELERKNAPNPRLRVAEDGQVLRDTTRTADASDFAATYPEYVPPVTVPRLRFDDLSRPAQETIKAHAADREIANIHEDTINGRKAYAAQFRERGRNPWVYLAEDGSVLRPTEKPPALGIGTTFSDLPLAAQQTIKRKIDTGEIVKIDREGARDEAPVYRVKIKDARGEYELRVALDGRVLGYTRAAEPPARRGCVAAHATINRSQFPPHARVRASPVFFELVELRALAVRAVQKALGTIPAPACTASRDRCAFLLLKAGAHGRGDCTRRRVCRRNARKRPSAAPQASSNTSVTDAPRDGTNDW